jgi:hypothetical protein
MALQSVIANKKSDDHQPLKKSLTSINLKNRLKIGKKITVVICCIMGSIGQLLSMVCNVMSMCYYLEINTR